MGSFIILACTAIAWPIPVVRIFLTFQVAFKDKHVYKHCPRINQRTKEKLTSWKNRSTENRNWNPEFHSSKRARSIERLMAIVLEWKDLPTHVETCIHRLLGLMKPVSESICLHITDFSVFRVTPKTSVLKCRLPALILLSTIGSMLIMKN